MSLTLTPLIELINLSARNGRHFIQESFAGNILAVHLKISPNLDRSQSILGVLTQHLGDVRTDYMITAAQSVIQLRLPETESLSFFPMSALYNDYGLDLAYFNVNSMSEPNNVFVLPENIAGLPARVATLEADTTTWEEVTNKPVVFNPTPHNHSISAITGLTDSLADKSNTGHTHPISDIVNLSDALSSLDSDLSTLQADLLALQGNTSTGNSSLNYTAISANTALQSGKAYLATVAGLVCSTPANPSIGDTIDLAVGNFSLTVLHGDTSHRILNNNTLSTAGLDNGIILKPYASIRLVYTASNLWVASNKSRTVNNWLLPVKTGGQTVSVPSATASIPAYTGLGSTIESLFNGNTVAGSGFANGYYSGSTPAQNTGVDFTLTLAAAIELDGFSVWGGQGNSDTEAFNIPNSLKIYSDTAKTNLLGTFTIDRAIGQQQFTLNLNGATYSSYVFNFAHTNRAVDIALMELRLSGYSVVGGEITV